jgi:mono/diheme cytochrome c family protein
LIGATVLASTAAFGLPWDIDMADGQAKKAYSRQMQDIPDGAIAQPNIQTPVGWTANFERTSDEGQALTAPFAYTDATLETGERMYGIYCTPCHGDGENLGPVAAPGRFPGVIPLSGPAGVAKMRSDGWIYLTIRNGGAVMPSYGWAMHDAEMWSIVQYVRTLPGAEYIPPAPAEADEETQP